jgi:hypothetical protein
MQRRRRPCRDSKSVRRGARVRTALLVPFMALLVFCMRPSSASVSPAPSDPAPLLAVSENIGIWGRAVIDSYDASTGPYGGANVSALAVVCTNETRTNKFELADSPTLNGSAYCGPEGSPDAVIRTWGGSTITGEKAARLEAVSLPAVVTPSMPASEGRLNLWGSQTRTVTATTRFSSINLSSRSSLVIDGDVDLFCDGNVSLSGSTSIELTEGSSLDFYVGGSVGLWGGVAINAAGQVPADCRIHMYGSGKNLETGSDAQLHARVLNPQGSLRLWNRSDFFGSFAGRSFAIGDSAQAHLDVSSPVGGGTVRETTTYYVRLSGSDGLSGRTPESAFRTIGRAAAVMLPGDMAYVGGGTYDEVVSVGTGGEAGSPVTFVADVTGAETGDAGIVQFGRVGATCLEVVGANDVTFRGFTISGGDDGVLWEDAARGQLIDCTISEQGDVGIEVQNADLLIEGCRVSSNRGHGMQVTGATSLDARDSWFVDNGRKGVTCDGADIALTMQRCRVGTNTDQGLEIRRARAQLGDCLIDGNGKEGVKVSDGSDNVTVTHCTIAENGDHGLKQEAGRVTITSSIIAGNTGKGIMRLGGTLTHTHNLFHGNDAGDVSGTAIHASEMQINPAFAPGSTYDLASSSPARDAAPDPTEPTHLDFDGDVRPFNDAYDIGCQESQLAHAYRDVTDERAFSALATSNDHQGAGWHWGDLDNDGDLDAVLSGTYAKIMLNDRDSERFTVVSLRSAWRQGVLVDLDHDGDLDFWSISVGSYNTESWFENDGTGRFTLIDDAGFHEPRNNEGAAGADINGDGWCDIVMFSESGNYIGRHSGLTPLALNGSKSPSDGLHERGSYGNGDFCSSADANDDGRIDFFYHYGGGRLFLSNEDGSYTRDNQGISVVTGNEDKFGSSWGDYDGDGDMDLFVPRYDQGQPSYLWRNDGGAFVNVAVASGIDDTGRHRGSAWGDYDHDGDLDLLIGRDGAPCVLYANLGDGSFVMVDEGLTEPGSFHDVCFVDYDNDGDLDIAAARRGAGTVLYENGIDDSAYLKVRVIGAGVGGTNLAGVGVRIDLFDGSGETLLGRRVIGTARGFGGIEPMWAHFGGLDPDQTYRLRAYFQSGPVTADVIPSDASTTIGDQVVPQLVTLTEPPVSSSAARVLEWTEVYDDEQ